MNSVPTLLPPPETPLPPFVFKGAADDFVVDELPLYEPSGQGTHIYFHIEKRNLNTRDAVRILADHFGQKALGAGVAGLKDARAVTRQWISFEHVRDLETRRTAFSHPQVTLLDVRAHGNKLKMGHLSGNRFAIRLAVEGGAGSIERIRARCEFALGELQRRGIPNCYGTQRFGRDGRNPYFGKLLVRGDLATFNAEHARRADPKLRNLYVNAYQAELFNRVLARRLPDLGTLQAGDLAYLHRNGAVFAIASADEARREQPRADAFEISPSGPLYGAKMKFPEGAPAELERAVLAEEQVTSDDFGRREAEKQPGARRPLRIAFLEAPAVNAGADGVRLSFALPSGAYATVVLREIFGNSADFDLPA